MGGFQTYVEALEGLRGIWDEAGIFVRSWVVFIALAGMMG
jgi:hypothetical protein